MRNLHLQSLQASDLPLAGSSGDGGDVHVELFCVNPGDGCLYVATSDGQVLCLSRDGGKVSFLCCLSPQCGQHYLALTTASDRNSCYQAAC